MINKKKKEIEHHQNFKLLLKTIKRVSRNCKPCSTNCALMTLGIQQQPPKKASNKKEKVDDLNR